MPPKSKKSDDEFKPEDQYEGDPAPGEGEGEGEGGDEPSDAEVQASEPEADRTPAGKIADQVRPMSSAREAFESVLTGVLAELDEAFHAGDDKAKDMIDHFLGEAGALADAALEGTDQAKGADGDAAAHADFKAGLLQDERPHNHDAVESAVRHGMDRDKAHAMTTHGSNI